MKKLEDQAWSLCGDFHCGAPTGLTPDPRNKIQEVLLDRYKDALKWLGPVDKVLVNGDLIDGRDPKSRDYDVEDMLDQAEQAARLIVMQKPKDEVLITMGTRYHETLEAQGFHKHVEKCVRYWSLKELGREIPVTFRRKLKTTINKWFLMEARHFQRSSSVFQGRSTASLRSMMWNVVNAAYNGGKWPDLLVFSHVHYWTRAENAWATAVTLPCFQALGGAFGDEVCDGHVDVGLARLTVGATKETGWHLERKLYPASAGTRTDSR